MSPTLMTGATEATSWDWAESLATLGIGLLLGVVTGYVLPIFLKRRDSAQIERDVYRELNAVAADVIGAVSVEPHGVTNKDRWVTRLNGLADRHKVRPDDVGMIVRGIAYKIEDSPFDHNVDDVIYCCDHVVLDLTLLSRELLPSVQRTEGWPVRRFQETAEQLEVAAWKLVVGKDLDVGEAPPRPIGASSARVDRADVEGESAKAARWYAEWKRGAKNLPPGCVMSMWIQSGH